MRHTPDSKGQSVGLQTVRGTVVALSLSIPFFESSVPGRAQHVEPGAAAPTAVEDKPGVRIECDDQGRVCREICDAQGWSDILEPSSGKRLFREYTVERDTRVLPYDDYGATCLPFLECKALNSALTEQEYLGDVAQRFKTIESLDRYFKAYFQYTFDTPDPTQPLLIGKDADQGDYWQTPKQTLNRMEKGKYLGDCDDLAFLAQAILQAQGKLPLVIFTEGPPGSKSGHARCVWVERSSGRYHARAICAMRYSETDKGKDTLSVNESYATATDALQELLNRYAKVVTQRELNVSCGFRKEVTALVISSVTGERLRSSAPFDTLTDSDLYLDLQILGGRSLQEIIGECRERIAGEDPRPELYLSLVAALRRESLKDSLEEIEGALRAVCDLQPDSHECRDQFGRFYLDINQPTQAMDQFLKAVRLGSRSEFVLYQLTRLAPHLMEYVSEFGVETLVEALPALRFAIHDTGYQKEDVRFFRSCALILGKPEDSLPVLAGRVNTCFKAAHSISDAFISGSAARSEYLHALSDLLRAQVEVGQIREARETFKRIRNHAGARKQINTFLPSLRHLPYREDLSAFYSEVLGEFSGWSGGHVELAEYLYRAGHYDQASDQIVKAAACCYDFPTLLGDLAAMPNLATHQRWPEILEVMTRRRAELRALRR